MPDRGLPFLLSSFHFFCWFELTVRPGSFARGKIVGAILLSSCRGLGPCPVLGLFAALARRTSECHDFGHLEAHFVLDDFTQGNVGRAEVSDVGNQRPAQASTAGI